MNADDVKNLANLARLKLTDQECDEYLNDFHHIFAYIDNINEVDVPERDTNEVLTNVVREDHDAYEPAQFTEDLLNGAPDREGNYFKVRKIL